MAADLMNPDIRIKALELAIDAVTKGAVHGSVEDTARRFEAFLTGISDPSASIFGPGFTIPSDGQWVSATSSADAKRYGME